MKKKYVYYCVYIIVGGNGRLVLALKYYEYKYHFASTRLYSAKKCTRTYSSTAFSLILLQNGRMIISTVNWCSAYY